jgi:membrane protease YdiL (CAAX protease family)
MRVLLHIWKSSRTCLSKPAVILGRLRYTRRPAVIKPPASTFRPPHAGPLIRVELAASAILLAVSAAWSLGRGVDLLGVLRPTMLTIAWGVGAGLLLATTLPLVTAPWARRVLVLRGLKRAWDALESGLGPGLRIREVLVLAVCSGISEEIFFRGVLLHELGIVGSSVLFGLLHPLGIAYVLWATAAGAGFGVLYLATGSLVAPALAHGTYNLIALGYLRRRSGRERALSFLEDNGRSEMVEARLRR